MRKGQVTLFSILGILLLLFVVMYFFSYFILKEKPAEQAAQEIAEGAADQPIKAFIDSCVAQTSRLALFYFGFIGGDTTPPAYQSYFSYSSIAPLYRIPYLSVQLTDQFVKNTLAQYVTQKLQKCTAGYSQFKGVTIAEEAQKTEVSLLEREVLFAIHYPVTTMRDGKKSRIGPDYTFRMPLRLHEMIGITNRILEMKAQEPSLIQWNYLTDVTQKDYNITAYAEVDKTIIYRLVDTKHELFGEPYVFQFAVKVN